MEKQNLLENIGNNLKLKEIEKITIEKDILKEKEKIIKVHEKSTLLKKDKDLLVEYEDNLKLYETELSNINKDIEELKLSVPGDKNNLSNISKDSNINEILEDLKTGVKNVMTSEQYQKYLDFRSSLYDYSVNNCLLIQAQKPDATMIGSFTYWKNNNRYVNKGEKGIKILAPVTGKRNIEIPILDKDLKPILNSDGSKQMKKSEKTVITGFSFATVFDVKQTSGEPIPSLINELSGNSSVAEKLIETIKSISNVPISYKNISSGAKGYYSPNENEIVLKEGMSLDQTAKTLIHEYTHSKLDNNLNEYKQNRNEAEIRAESTAYVVSKHFGLDTSEYSFGYVTSWAAGKQLDELQETLKTISDTSKNIINEIETSLEKEYEKVLIKNKDKIKSMIKDNGFKATDSVVGNILKLNKVTGKNHTLTGISELYKKEDSFDDNKEAKNCLDKVGKELKSQELLDKSKSKNFEPEMA